MSNASDIVVQNDAQTVLENACARNASVELHRRVGEIVHPVARARLLGMNTDTMFLEAPQTIGREVNLIADERLECYFLLSEIIYSFVAKVKHTHCNLRLNRRKVVDGMTITRPSTVQEGQRREFYRTSLAAQPPITAHLHETTPGAPEETPIGASRFTGRLLDASAGGFGLNVDCPPGRFKVFHPYFLQFEIPERGLRMDLLTELRQARPIHDGMSSRLGLMCVPWPHRRAFESQVQRLTRYLTEVQRQQRR